ncbi:hypothetical protein [Streptomyces sp. ML-6]|uniref:hypothetical protein n=1 Tax=Streptomyces sp. ML-6 TaxID=2982693 RepID=UPI0024BF8A49|nr:hypothetical protein [Streptomyces sp. ML-6]MDK0524751.1 hypothetical protein [Streptomyces sp. ML-6]
MPEPHPLLAHFTDASDGRFPSCDGGVTVLPPLPGGLECSVAFTGHAVVATALSAAEVHAGRPDGFGASLAPDFLRRLAGPDGWIDTVDVTLTARGTGGPPRPASPNGRRERTPTPASSAPVNCGTTSRSTATNGASSPWPTALPDAAS